MKTVLAPNAPWPMPPIQKKPKPKFNPPARVLGRSAKVDEKFNQWLEKRNGRLDG